MSSAFVLCISIALCWSAAPFVGKISGLNPWVMAILTIVGGLIPMIFLALNQNFSTIGARGISLGLLAGVINALGIIAWYRLVVGSTEGLWELSSVLPIALILLCVALAIGGRIFFDEPFTVNKVIGIFLAGGAIWFLR